MSLVDFLKYNTQPWVGGSVGWRVVPHTKTRGSDSQPGHTPGLQVQPLSRCILEAANLSFSITLMSLSVSLSVCLSLSLKSINISLGEGLNINK